MPNICQPVAEWLKTEIEGECRPCGIAAMVGEYQHILEDSGHPELSTDITKALLDTKDPVGAVAEMMDKVKSKVSEEIKNQLQEIDCNAQKAVEEEKKEE